MARLGDTDDETDSSSSEGAQDVFHDVNNGEVIMDEQPGGKMGVRRGKYNHKIAQKVAKINRMLAAKKAKGGKKSTSYKKRR